MVFFSLPPLRARKSVNYCYRDSWKSDNFRERAIKKEAKNWYKKRMQKGLRVIILQGAIEKSSLLLSLYWKFEWLDGTIIISNFSVSNKIFVDCTLYLNFNFPVITAEVVITTIVSSLPTKKKYKNLKIKNTLDLWATK